MESERRLHPASFLFALGDHARALVLPGLFVLLSSRSGRGGWQVWAMIVIVPIAIAAAVRALSYRYRFDDAELVIRTGFVFRNERHIPYGRIQNVDAVQNVLHRAFGLADVRIETGGATEGEARMSVVSLEAFRELRDRVLVGRAPAEAGAAAGAVTADPVLRLPLREVILCGLIEGRGLVVLGGLFGLLWETGFIDNFMGGLFGEPTSGRGAVRQFVRAIFAEGLPSAGRMGLTLAAFGIFLVIVRVFSAGWAVVTLYGFKLVRVGDDLQLEYGLFTRVTATVPIRRIQALTIHEGPLYRLCGRVAVRVDTAGGQGEDTTQGHRQRLVPLLRRSELPELLRAALPAHDGDVAWNGVDPCGFRRKVKPLVVLVALAAMGLAWPLGLWTVPAVVVLLAWAAVHARQAVRALGWAMTERAVFFRSGWCWRNTTIAPLGKIQVVAVRESPFDRRLQMAGVLVDTAGAGGESHRVRIPYLSRETADGLAGRLAAHTAQSTFRW
jgi:putative membrane protein